MTRQVVFRSPEVNRTRPLLSSEDSTTSTVRFSQTPAPAKGKKIGEAAGGAAAECAAVCCCCPCTVMNLVVLAVYKVPSGLCRKAWRKRKRRRLVSKRQSLLGGPTGEDSVATSVDPRAEFEVARQQSGEDQEALELEKEMWQRFYGTGFWRSPSQRSTS